MIDKGLYKRGRVGLKGGADAATASFAKSAGFGQKTAKADPKGGFNLGGGQGPTFGGAQATQTSGDDGRRARQEFIKNVQKTNPGYTGGPSRDSFLKRAISGGIGFAKRNPLQILLSAINPVFGAAMLGANFLNNPEIRKKYTGYETQAEYDQARQDRINRKKIATLENTIQKKYLDKGRSLTETDLDERLAALKESMGIQDTAPNVMTGRDLNLRGIETLDTGNNIIDNMISNIDKLSNQPNLQELYNRDRILSGMNTFVAPPGQSGGITNTKVQPPDFMFGSPQFQESLDNSMYGGDRMLFGADENKNYYYGDVLPGGNIIQTDADGITNYDFDTPVQDTVPLDPNLNIFKVNDLRAELTDKQKRFIDSKKFPLQENLVSPQSVFDTITNPDLGIYDTGTFGFGAQEPTTEEEYNDYLRSLGLTQTI